MRKQPPTRLKKTEDSIKEGYLLQKYKENTAEKFELQQKNFSPNFCIESIKKFLIAKLRIFQL